MAISGQQAYIPGRGDGDGASGLSVVGTGKSVPAGLEAVLEYNGILLNVQRNIDYYRISQIDGLADSDIRDTRDVNTDDDGETPFNSFYGGRSIVITGTIMTYSAAKLRDMQQALRTAFVDTSKERPLHFRLGDFTKDHVINCKKVGTLAIVEQQQNQMVARDFQVTLRASNPRFLSYYGKHIYKYPAYSVQAPYQFATLINEGNYWAQPKFRIYGPSYSTTITNETTGKSFTISNIPMLAEIGRWMYFDFDMALKTLKDVDGNNQWKTLNDNSDYILLQGMTDDNPTGENVIFVATDAPRIEISWYDSWM